MTVVPPWEVDHNPEYRTDDPKCTFWIQATPGTTWWRCYTPAKELGGQAINLTPQDIVDHPGGRKEFPNQKGPAVWQFPGNRTRGWIMAEMRRQGIPVFVEVDDNYLVPSLTQPGLLPHWPTKTPKDNPEATSREMHREIVKHACDGVIVSTKHLQDFYGRIHPNVHVCPNSVDPDDWPDPVKLDDGIFRIGYAFSSSHYWDWPLILDALEYAAAQPDVEIVLMGQVPPYLQLNRFKYVNFPWSNSLESYRKNLQVLDVGLAPLKSGPWADSRSDIKAMELAMAGALTVCSPTVSYEMWGDDEGLPRVCLMPLENTSKAWVKIITWLLKNREVAKEIAAEAKAYVLDQRTIKQGAESWREAFSSVGALV